MGARRKVFAQSHESFKTFTRRSCFGLRKNQRNLCRKRLACPPDRDRSSSAYIHPLFGELLGRPAVCTLKESTGESCVYPSPYSRQSPFSRNFPYSIRQGRDFRFYRFELLHPGVCPHSRIETIRNDGRRMR